MKCCDQDIKSVGDQTLDDNTSDHLDYYNIGEEEVEEEILGAFELNEYMMDGILTGRH